MAYPLLYTYLYIETCVLPKLRVALAAHTRIVHVCGGTWLGLYPTSLSYLITVFNFLQFQLCLIILGDEKRNETSSRRTQLRIERVLRG